MRGWAGWPEFPVYELVEGWHGPRWLADILGDLDDLPIGITLECGTRPRPVPRHAWLAVTTRLRAAGRAEVVLDDDAVAYEAIVTLFHVMSSTIADVDTRRRLSAEGRAYIDRRARAHPRWAACEWTVSGQRQVARYARFAEGWAGFVPGESGRTRLICTGYRIGPDGLVFAPVAEWGRYHVERASPPDIRTAGSSLEAALGPLDGDGPHPRSLHRDMRALLAIERDPSWKERCAYAGCAAAPVDTWATQRRTTVFGVKWAAGQYLRTCSEHSGGLTPRRDVDRVRVMVTQRTDGATDQ